MTRFEAWRDSPALSESEWKELDAIKDDENEIESRFFSPLEFGTAGLRGTMKLGLHHMNTHVVRHATQSFANVILSSGEAAELSTVIICYDCRTNSETFARQAACVMAANGINVKIFDALRPTPELSFAIRHYGATAGINVTASHNPKEYNGFKVYWGDGAQLPPEKAAQIAEQMEQIDIFTGFKIMDFEDAVEKRIITMLGQETDELFLQNVLAQSIDKSVVEEVSDDFRVVFTPFHGAGHALVPEALRRLGVKHVFPVREQMVIDGGFPTVESPNPENPEGFHLAVKLAKEEGGGLIIGTDPDADRIGVMVRSGEEYISITGNQLGVLLLHYILEAKKSAGTLPENAAVIKSIVTTTLADEVAKSAGVHVENTFTGFKFMAEVIAEWEKTGEYKYVFAYEESYGYMMGDYVRDKDAVTASMMITEMAAFYSKKGMTLCDALNAIYEQFGYFKEETISLLMPGIDGLEDMRRLMTSLRSNPPEEMAGISVTMQRDYEAGTLTVANLGIVGQTHIVGSNVLFFELADGSVFVVRPSGTEPKIKIYILVRGSGSEQCDQKIKSLKAYAETLKSLAQ